MYNIADYRLASFRVFKKALLSYLGPEIDYPDWIASLFSLDIPGKHRRYICSYGVNPTTTFTAIRYSLLDLPFVKGGTECSINETVE